MAGERSASIGPRNQFSLGGIRFSFRSSRTNLLDACFDGFQAVAEAFIKLIGPLLILLALSIIGLLCFVYFYVIVPKIRVKHQESPYGGWIVAFHTTWVTVLVFNILFNYAYCVCTRNAGTPQYDQVVRELAEISDLSYPETPNELQVYKRDFEDRMVLRMQRRRERAAEQADAAARKASTTSTTAKKIKETPLRSWMLLGPYEWSYCNNSHQAKPPRSHFDHVSKSLVLNLDHYCPWMFNAIGYFNYRYFVNFLVFVMIGMAYGAVLLLEPFSLSQTSAYREYSRHERMERSHLPPPTPMMPHRDEKMYVSLSFMICVAVGVAVSILGGFHIFLTFTAQTTIEFHGNWVSRSKAKRLKQKWKNPYDLGWKRNFQQVYGSGPWWTAFLPSSRQPEFLPVPIPGRDHRRKTKSTVKNVRDQELSALEIDLEAQQDKF